MINELRQQTKNKMQVKAEIKLDINLKCKLWLNFHSENKV